MLLTKFTSAKTLILIYLCDSKKHKCNGANDAQWFAAKTGRKLLWMRSKQLANIRISRSHKKMSKKEWRARTHPSVRNSRNWEILTGKKIRTDLIGKYLNLMVYLPHFCKEHSFFSWAISSICSQSVSQFLAKSWIFLLITKMKDMLLFTKTKIGFYCKENCRSSTMNESDIFSEEIWNIVLFFLSLGHHFLPIVALFW